MRFAFCRLGVAFIAATATTHLFTAGIAAAAGTSPAPKVLRHLTFDIGLDVESRTDTKVSGIEGPASGTASSTGTSLGKGTISVDVIGVTSDGGLVVDVSENTDTRKAAAARVAIVGNSLSYAPSSNVTEEESDVLRFLSRTFVKEGELSDGTTWSDSSQAPGTTERTTYKVTAVHADAKTIDVAVDETTSVTGPHGFEGTTRGTLTYDTDVLVPLTLSLATRRRFSEVGQSVTVDMKLTSTLTSDSFHKPASS